MYKTLFRFYYRVRLTIWALLSLPKYLHVGNTNFSIPAHNWMVAIPCMIGSTEVRYVGRFRNRGRYFYEPLDYPHFLGIVSGKKVFFDVGANIGWYSFIAADAGVERIVAFEFMKEYADFTSKNFIRNNILGTVVNKGVGNPKQFANYSDPLAKIGGSLISLDEYAKENNLWPDIIKMDIEGFELDALKNAHEILLRKPALDISLHDPFLKERGQSADEVLELLRNYGYKIIWEDLSTYFLVAD
jgi:FkbM family methyltransferase